MNIWFLKLRARCLASAAVLLLAPLCTATALAAGSGIHGRVIGQDADRKFVGMVQGAKIEASDFAGEVAGQTTANAQGYYRLDLPPGQYRYKVTADGYKDEDAGRGVRIEKSDGYQTFHFALQQGTTDPDGAPPALPTTPVGTLSGRVLEQTAEGEKGIAEAEITLVQEGTRELVRVVSGGGDEQQGENGSYTVVLPQGTWRASVHARGFERLVDPEPIVITADESQRDFVLHRREVPDEVLARQGIRGTVAIIEGGRQRPAPFDVHLEIHTARGVESPYAQTLTGGTSDFGQATPPGVYQVVASAPDSGYAEAVRGPVTVFAGRYSHVKLILQREAVPEPDEAVVTPPAEEEQEEKVIPVEPSPAEIEIAVIDRTTKQPVPDAEVLIRSVSDRAAEIERAASDARGLVHFSTAPGKYFVVTRLEGHRVVAGSPQPNFVRGRLVLDVAAGQTRRGVLFLEAIPQPSESEPPADIRPPADVTPPAEDRLIPEEAQEDEVRPMGGALIAVYDAKTRKPLSGASVHLVRSDGRQRTATTTGRGEAAFPRLQSATYQLQVSLSGYQPVRRIVQFVGEKPRIAVPMYAQAETPRPTPDDWPRPRPDDRPRPTPEEEPRLVTVSGSVLAQPERGLGLALIEGATLRWEGPTTATVRSETSGRYRLSLPTGSYRVTVTPPATSDLTPATFDRVLITRDTLRNFSLHRRGATPPDELRARPSLTIQVVDQTSKPVAGATVQILPAEAAGGTRPATIRSGTSDASGRYRTQLEPGSFLVKVSGQNIDPGGTSVRISSADISRQIRVNRHGATDQRRRTVEPPLSRRLSNGQAAVTLEYTAQYMAPGERQWRTIGTFSSRAAAEQALKLAKIPLKSQTRIVPRRPSGGITTPEKTTGEVSPIRPSLRKPAGEVTPRRPALRTLPRLQQTELRMPADDLHVGLPPIPERDPDVRSPEIDPRLRTPRLELPTRTVTEWSLEYMPMSWSPAPQAQGHWTVYGTYSTRGEAERAKFFALEHGRIPEGARVRIIERQRSVSGPPRRLQRMVLMYVVRCQLPGSSDIRELGVYATEAEAQRALFLAVDHGRVPGDARLWIDRELRPAR